MIDEKEVLKILKRYEGRMNPTAYFSLEADIVNIEEYAEPTTKNNLGVDWEELKSKILMEVDGGTDDNWLRYGEVCDRISNSIDDFKANLPSVTPQEPRWIPISEKLPEKNVEVLATTEWDAVTIAEMYSANDWFIHEGATNAETDEIAAWMPLPKAYREVEE